MYLSSGYKERVSIEVLMKVIHAKTTSKNVKSKSTLKSK